VVWALLAIAPQLVALGLARLAYPGLSKAIEQNALAAATWQASISIAAGIVSAACKSTHGRLRDAADAPLCDPAQSCATLSSQRRRGAGRFEAETAASASHRFRRSAAERPQWG
jgi:hypothetical protein